MMGDHNYLKALRGHLRTELSLQPNFERLYLSHFLAYRGPRPLKIFLMKSVLMLGGVETLKISKKVDYQNPENP